METFIETMITSNPYGTTYGTAWMCLMIMVVLSMAYICAQVLVMSILDGSFQKFFKKVVKAARTLASIPAILYDEYRKNGGNAHE